MAGARRPFERLSRQRLRRTIGAASCVGEPARFAARELRNDAAVAEYMLHGSRLRAVLRHPLLDMWAIEEIFSFRSYEPPQAVRSALAALGRPLRIIDLGGRVGCFGLFMRTLYPDAKVSSFEPEPGNARILRRCVEVNELEKNWTVIEASASTTDGQVAFISDFHLSRTATLSAAPPLEELHQRIATSFPFMRESRLLTAESCEVTSRDVFPFLFDADLIKIDIEGGEWEILSDARLEDLKAAAIVLEYHPAYCPEDDPKATVLSRLSDAGYTTAGALHNKYGGFMWGWKAGAGQALPAPSSR